MLRLISRKVFGELTWSVLVIGVISVGLIAWIVIPSISTSLESGLQAYADGVATWVNVSEHGGSGGLPLSTRLPRDVIAQIESLPKIEKVYPVILNGTAINGTGFFTFPNGTTVKLNVIEVIPVAALGGTNGYPIALVTLVGGRMPRPGTGEIIVNGGLANLATGRNFAVNDTVTFMFRSQNSSDYENGLRLNATVVGIAAYNPVFIEAHLLFDPTFLTNELGAPLYDQTFGGQGANFLVLKAGSIRDVNSIADQTSMLLTNYPSYYVIYDEALLLSLQAFETQTFPLYRYIQLTSLLSSVSVTLLVTHLAAGRRKWEIGLLRTQGWNWMKVTQFLFGYYFVLGAISFAVSAVISAILSSFLVFSYGVLGGSLVIPVILSQVYVYTAVLTALSISILACAASVWRLRRIGIDTILRAY